eukprot:CAMPEP_0178458980 /NCGR_PEP_ID=MMETSP0689_2-20121128/47853_1 /TAXON_ID=160604 /ORGANISM="Amphidinium massartii, Strain CS-259" /LENGTH=40 /DNA_ID= /DNA_START= /DNA_END= /DNA_ORIENTATION=
MPHQGFPANAGGAHQAAAFCLEAAAADGKARSRQCADQNG